MRCHRDLKAPERDVNGETPSHSMQRYRFPASVVLESAYALGDALLGRRTWDEEEVLMERNVLLGPNDNTANNLVEKVRQRGV